MKVTLDGRTLVTGLSENEAFAWLLRNQGQSVGYALEHGGYSIEDDD